MAEAQMQRPSPQEATDFLRAHSSHPYLEDIFSTDLSRAIHAQLSFLWPAITKRELKAREREREREKDTDREHGAQLCSCFVDASLNKTSVPHNKNDEIYE
jgi:hypothetical protein